MGGKHTHWCPNKKEMKKDNQYKLNKDMALPLYQVKVCNEPLHIDKCNQPRGHYSAYVHVFRGFLVT